MDNEIRKFRDQLHDIGMELSKLGKKDAAKKVFAAAASLRDPGVDARMRSDLATKAMYSSVKGKVCPKCGKNPCVCDKEECKNEEYEGKYLKY